ncbi:ubiquitin family protein [Coprinopsis marcescibilis]|uniref:Ubiquitin family protein n=1 Tax=Coprinopsis marcescibilis TaxID=230819 RepID=A0A5C3LDS1_COPMA|nr:ubiquitin family protein [Coprinopsis marcescibilis]
MASADFQAEQAFARTFLNTIGRQPVTYGDDYRQPAESSLRRVPVLAIPVPPVPERKVGESSSSAAISLTFKSLKPALSYTLPVSLTDSILTIKTLLHEKYSEALPSAEHQRILLKGKALADQKLLKEYNVKDGDTLNLVFKPVTAPSEPVITAPKPVQANVMSNPFASVSGSLDPNVKSSAGGKRHQRIPSVVLSPSPSNDTANEEIPREITLDLDSGNDGVSPVMRDELGLASTYHNTVAKPEFWEKMVKFLKSEFQTEADFHLAFEDFLCATKGSLTASQIAKIRDHVGIVGMAGT